MDEWMAGDLVRTIEYARGCRDDPFTSVRELGERLEWRDRVLLRNNTRDDAAKALEWARRYRRFINVDAHRAMTAHTWFTHATSRQIAAVRQKMS